MVWRILFVTLAALSLALSGCIATDEEPETPAVEPEPEPVPEPVLPDPIEASETVTGSLDPMNFVSGYPCQTPTATCHVYEFTVNGSATMDAELTWLVAANDFDLYLFEGEEQLELAADGPPENVEALQVSLSAGDYSLVVVGWAVAADTFTLEATFS